MALAQNKLFLQNPQAQMHVGTDLAMDANLMLIGASGRFSGNGPSGLDPGYAGAAYLYGVDAWGDEIYIDQLAPAELQPGDAFGAAVAMTSETLVVGAPGSDVSALMRVRSTCLPCKRMAAGATIRGEHGHVGARA